MKRIRLRGGDEYDALTGWRKFLSFRSGVRKAIKRQYNRRFRKAFKRDVKDHVENSE